MRTGAGLAGLVGMMIATTCVAAAQTTTPLVHPAPEAGLLAVQTPRFECGGQAVVPVIDTAFNPIVTTVFTDEVRASLTGNTPLESTLLFSIWADGRTADIRVDTTDTGQANTAYRLYSAPSDQAVLAGIRFAPQARRDCQVRLSRQRMSLAEASLATLALAREYSSPNPAQSRAIGRTMIGEGNCTNRRRLARSARPPTPEDHLAPGVRRVAVARFDIDGDGATSNIEIVNSTGNDAADDYTRQAVSQATFHPGPADQGCIRVLPFVGTTLENEPEPEPTDDPLQDCPAEVRQGLTYAPLIYPEAFEASSIQGWAIIRYDISSWGEVGGIEVVSYQPSEVFAKTATGIMSRTRGIPGFRAAVRCTDRFNFVLADDVPADPASDTAAP